MQFDVRSRIHVRAAGQPVVLGLGGCGLACLLLLLPAPRFARAEDERPSITWSTIRDGYEDQLAVGISSVEVVPLDDAPDMHVRRLAVRSTYTQAVSGTLVVLHRRPGSDVEWPLAFHLYVGASPPGRIMVANYMVAIDVSPLRTLGAPPAPPRDLPVRAYLLGLRMGAEARPLAGQQIQPFDPVLDALDEGLRTLAEAQWNMIAHPLEEVGEDFLWNSLSHLAGTYWTRRADPVARTSAAALLRFGDQIGVKGLAYYLARALETPAAEPDAEKRPGLHAVPVSDPDEAARQMERSAREDGEPLAWFHLFKTSPDEEERFIYALLLRSWEQVCPGDRFEGIEEVLQAGNTRWTQEQGMKLIVRATRLGAEAGFAALQVRLAGLHLEGVGGVPQDLKAAKDWAYKAAQRGDVDGEVLFANLLMQTVNPDDMELAAQYFESAAKLGHAHAAFSLASMHFRAMLGLPNHEEAAFYLGIAARLGHAQAVAAIDEMLAKLPKEQRAGVIQRIDDEMPEIEKRQKTRAERIQKERRTGAGHADRWQ